MLEYPAHILIIELEPAIIIKAWYYTLLHCSVVYSHEAEVVATVKSSIVAEDCVKPVSVLLVGQLLMTATLLRFALTCLRELVTISALHDPIKIEVVIKLTPTVDLDHFTTGADTEPIDVDLKNCRHRLNPHELLRILFSLSLMVVLIFTI